MRPDKKKDIRFSYKKMNEYYKEYLVEGYADQTIKNLIHKHKKNGKYTLYLAALSAYNRVKLERTLVDDDKV